MVYGDDGVNAGKLGSKPAGSIHDGLPGRVFPGSIKKLPAKSPAVSPSCGAQPTSPPTAPGTSASGFNLAKGWKFPPGVSREGFYPATPPLCLDHLPS